MPPEYVRRLADDFESVALGGERAEITILFSDIRGFTNLSERLPPSAVIEILNEYLERMSEVVFRHGGTLDKFIGDAVMAFWGAPVPIADHANKALTAALDMIAELDGLNARWKERGEPTELAIGVGLNTGPAVVGNIGSLTRKLDYTAIGDAVNLASRLESLNKTYGTTILVSESTLTAAGGGYATRAVEAVTVKGKKKPVNVFELLGRKEDPAATGGSGPTLRGAMAAAALLVACATGASAQDERARWTDWLYVPGSWSAGQLVRSATSDADTEALALVAHVEAYSSLPRWRVEVSKLSDGETLEAPVVVIGGQTPPVVLTALGSAPLRLVRMRMEGGRLGPPQTLIDGIPGARNHDGSRLAFGQDGFLYVTTGDAGSARSAQDMNSLAGKILRVSVDGRPAPGNPFGNSIWTSGHRNPQGLVFQPGTGRLYAIEHGPATDDEVNVIVGGGNYGWPAVAGFCDQSDERAYCAAHAVVEPVEAWTPTVGTSGADFYGANAIPGWRGSLLVTSLRGAALWRIQLSPDGRRPVRSERLLQGQLGRLRDVLVGSDGAVYLATSNRDGRGSPGPDDDRIVRLVAR